MLSILGFLAILAPLVIVHEFGHYIFARIFGVKAEIFSVGFGPRLWYRNFGETEVRISAIPLGGYVKLLGEDAGQELPPKERKRALGAQEPWKRFFIFFGGPLFNFLFAIFVFMVILAVGEPKLAGVAGRVVDGSAAAKAGFQSGDTIKWIDGEKVTLFQDVMLGFMDHPEEPVQVQVERANGDKETLTVVPEPADGFSKFGEQRKVGRVYGLLPYPRTTHYGISDPKSEAGKQGLRTGGHVVSLANQKIESWEDLEQYYYTLPRGEDFKITIKAGAEAQPQTLTFEKPSSSKGIAKDLGLHSSELFVKKAIEESPASGAGIQEGDRLVAIDDEPIPSFYDLKDAIQFSGEENGKVRVSWERNGKLFMRTVVPMESRERDPVLKKVTYYTIGVMPMLELGQGVTVVNRVWNPFELVWLGTTRMVDFSYRNIVSIYKMITGDVSVATLGGPILIGKIAGDSLRRGFISFLTTMAILSIGLGILNILPIPVLDGGHLLLLVLEIIRGKPLTLRQMEIVQQVGLSLILLLMAVVMRNDLSRLSIFN